MSSAPTNQTGRDILIVDDSPMSLRLLTHILDMEGYHARPVTSGAEALAEIADAAPDLILLDVMMPEMSGFEFAAKLKANPETENIPIIFISALNDEESKVRALGTGGVDYITKPLHVNEVIARVTTHLRLRDARERLQQELEEREKLIDELDKVNEQLQQEVAERKAAQEAREASVALLRQALVKTEALYRITRSLITSEDIPDMLQIVADSVAEALPADRVVVITFDPEITRVTSFTAGGPGVESVVQPSFDELMAGLTGWVVERVQPVISPKDQPDPRESPIARRHREETRAGSMLVVPLYYQESMLGTMTVINAPEEPNFNEQHLAQLNAVAGQVAIALANARLSAETAYLKEFNEGIVQGVADAILLIDQNQRIVFANAAAEDMLGYPPDELIGQRGPVLVSDATLEKLDRHAEPSDLMSARFETSIKDRNGRSVHVLASNRPLYQEDEFAGILAALTDITEIKKAEDQLRRYAADLEAQNAELAAFAHTVAHDLRSPLTGLIGFIDLLIQHARETNDTDLQKYAHFLYRNSAKMNNIIDELLLLASVREMEEIELTPLNMGKIVEEAQARLDYLIDEYGAEVTLADDWPAAVGYPPWVEEVWVNYLSNAIKYGGRAEEGTPPRVAFGADAPPQNDGEMIRFWVQDNGVGLTSEQQSQLFTPFERLHNVRAEGHGLGLSIVQRILEKLGGEVGVESEVGAGSRFYFTLPRART
ncbi:MAG: response regulator, partial [Anaerolineae bacterium]